MLTACLFYLKYFVIFLYKCPNSLSAHAQQGVRIKVKFICLIFTQLNSVASLTDDLKEITLLAG